MNDRPRRQLPALERAIVRTLITLSALRGRTTGEDRRIRVRRWVQTRRGHILLHCLAMGIDARELAETRRLVHVNPHTIDIKTCLGAVERQELACPVLLDTRVEPVGVNSDTRPDDTKVVGAIGVLQPDAKSFSFVECVIASIGNGADGRVGHDDVLLIVLVEIVNDLAKTVEREILGVGGEDEAAVHVVDIGPHGLKWDATSLVV